MSGGGADDIRGSHPHPHRRQRHTCMVVTGSLCRELRPHKPWQTNWSVAESLSALCEKITSSVVYNVVHASVAGQGDLLSTLPVNFNGHLY